MKIDGFKVCVGDSFYHRRADLFCKVEKVFQDDTADVRYDWPHDGAKLVRVPLRELSSAMVAMYGS